MKCPSCAANYEDQFKYCPYCGTSKPQPPTVRLQVEEPKYEYCSVHTTRDTSADDSLVGGLLLSLRLGQGNYEWWVEAQGLSLADQHQVFARSKTFVSKIHELHKYEGPFKAAVGRQLEQDGWEQVEGTQKYRRRIS